LNLLSTEELTNSQLASITTWLALMAAILKLPRDEAAMQPLIEKVASFCPLKVPVRLVLQHFLSNLGSSRAANTAGKLTSIGVSLSV
jgi:hypothetical protein